MALDGRLGVSEEECVGRHRFLWLVGVLLLLLFLRFGFGLHHFCGGPLLIAYLEARRGMERKRDKKTSPVINQLMKITLFGAAATERSLSLSVRGVFMGITH